LAISRVLRFLVIENQLYTMFSVIFAPII